MFALGKCQYFFTCLESAVFMLTNSFTFFDKLNSANFRLRRCLVIVGLIAITQCGCSEAPQEDQFTHLWSSQGTHVWTHLGVEWIQVDSRVLTPPEFFLNRELLPEEKVKLVGGVVVRYDGDSLFINERLVTDNNVLIENDGTLIPNAYIKADH